MGQSLQQDQVADGRGNQNDLQSNTGAGHDVMALRHGERRGGRQARTSRRAYYDLPTQVVCFTS